MKIVVAPDSFKGSLTAKEVADCIESGIKKIKPDSQIIKFPMADGGEGTVQSLIDCTNGKLIKVKVNNPLFKEIEASYGILGDGKTAVIEMAEASGLPLLKNEEKNPLITSTFGTGQLIKHALDSGCRSFIIGIGGSATNDGGAGIVQCLGGNLLDENGDDIAPGGGSLSKLKKIDLSNFDNRIKDCKITVACDVANPLIGPNGASFVFGPQKGADKEMVVQLDKNLEHYASVINSTLNIDIKDIPGAGAAGGLGGGLLAFFNAELKRGIDIVINTVDLESYIQDADLVLTGEGMIDFQTQFGKTPFGVAEVASKYNVPVIGIAGALGKDIDILYQKGFKSLFSITDKPMSLDNSIKNSRELVSSVAERIIRLL